MSDIIVPMGSSVVPLDVAEANAADRRAARAPKTNSEYAKSWRRFCAWCEANNYPSLPTTLDVIGAYLRGLRDGSATPRGKGLSPASIEVALSAITVEHRLFGVAIDRKASVLEEYVAAAKRQARVGRVRQKKRPIKVADMQGLVSIMRRDTPIDVRDAAMLGLGFAAALRRSELSGLDLGHVGSGSGAIAITARGIEVILAVSKASQDRDVSVAVPARDMPTVCEAVARWVRLAAIQSGTPLFRTIGRYGDIRPYRMGEQSIARTIKARIVTLEVQRGTSRGDAERIAREFSGHSLRAGCVTSAAERKLPVYDIQRHSRHRSAEMVQEYIREADSWGDSPLRAFGF